MCRKFPSNGHNGLTECLAVPRVSRLLLVLSREKIKEVFLGVGPSTLALAWEGHQGA